MSAGNHPNHVRLDVAQDQIRSLSPEDLQTHVVRAVAQDARHRRLLSPAEALNVLTVGASHSDVSDALGVARAVQPYVGEGLPSVINAQGMGYRRSIKPDVLFPGGRVVLIENVVQTTPALLEVYRQTRPPGQSVAAPGQTPGEIGSFWYTRGTSNAAALASRAASIIHDMLEELTSEPGGELIGQVPMAVWLKALLVHGSSWGPAGNVLDNILRTPDNSRQFKEYITRLLGYGVVDVARVSECTSLRVTALGGGLLQAEQAHVLRFPLPFSLSGKRNWRRLVITLAWLTPVNPAHQAWRRAALWFEPSSDRLQVKRQQADWRAVQRGTVQHEILEGQKAADFIDGENLEIQVNCRADAGVLEETVPYALATTLEVAEDIGVDIYNEVRVRVHTPRVIVTSEA